jgi:16S rRNA (guanine527-N7)-methyltransferase
LIEIDPEAERRLAAFADLLRRDRRAPISRASRGEAERVHIADSLSGLEFEQLAAASRIADLGSGAGLPGLALAAARPEARVAAIESSSRKCRFIAEAIALMELDNAEVVCERSEDWAAGAGREAYDAVTVRAVGRLSTLAELASPLLRDGGFLLAWKGERDESEEAELARAGDSLALEAVEVRPVSPYAGSRGRHIHLLRKNGPTPERLPRRNGLAAKRPFGSE